MNTIDIDKLFKSSNINVLEFFSVAGVGYYIPDYQREYSWDRENINQLLDDITSGVERLLNKDEAENEIHFLGTVITVQNKEFHNKDPKGTPSRIDMVIDGQQRVITISIMASLFIKHLLRCQCEIRKDGPIYSEVVEIINEWKENLFHIVSVDLYNGTPRFKPRVIRGANDYWTSDGDINEAYRSEIANYEARFINTYINSQKDPATTLAVFEHNTTYSQNYKKIDRWLKKVEEAHIDNSIEFPDARQILQNIPERMIWKCSRNSLVSIVERQFSTGKDKESSAICSLVQILAACHYLLERCCVCEIKADKEDWAFDMFQSLNATGTPLTAIETFKPVIINCLKKQNVEYIGSSFEVNFNKVENFLSEPQTASLKTKRTNDFIVSFFVRYNGIKVPTHFSGERKALINNFESLPSIEEKERYIKTMGDYATFYKLWLDYDGSKTFKINASHEDVELVSLLMLFLKRSNHRMAITTLASAYQCIVNNEPNADENFIKLTKATAAFYFIWRSVFSNRGMDVAYRKLFDKKKGVVKCEEIISHFQRMLEDKGIKYREWKHQAKQFLKYSEQNKELIRFALLLAVNDTIPDNNKKGLIKQGKNGSFNSLKLEYWLADEFKTIEHVAPQKNNGMWDSKLYEQDSMLVNTLGNLTLLPQAINSSAGNKGFQEKLLYYKCVSEDDQDALNDVGKKAKSLGISLNENTIEILKACKYSNHVKSISTMDYCDSWKSELVNDRTYAMLEIIWNKLMSWLVI